MVSVFLKLAPLTSMHLPANSILLSGKHSTCGHTPYLRYPFLCCTSVTWLRGVWAETGVIWVSHMVDLFLGFWGAFTLILIVARLPYIPICVYPRQNLLLFVFLKLIYFYFPPVPIFLGIQSGFLNTFKPLSSLSEQCCCLECNFSTFDTC